MPLSVPLRPDRFTLNRESWQANGLLAWFPCTPFGPFVDYISGFTLTRHRRPAVKRLEAHLGGGYALDLTPTGSNAAGAYGTTPARFDGLNPFTVVCYIVPRIEPESSSQFFGVTHSDTDGAPYIQYDIATTPSGASAEWFCGNRNSADTFHQLASTVKVQDYFDQLCVLAYKKHGNVSGDHSLWLNGTQIASATHSTGAPSFVSTAEIIIGDGFAHTSGINRWAGCDFLEGRIYARPLSDAEIVNLSKPAHLWDLYKPYAPVVRRKRRPQIAGTIITDNWTAYYDLDEVSGDAIDAVGNADLTDVNTVGSASGARDFEAGNSERFTRADDATFSMGADTPFTFVFMYNAETEPHFSAMPLFSKGGGHDATEYFLFFANSGNFEWHVGNGSSKAQVNAPVFSSGFPLPQQGTGTWHYGRVWHDPDLDVIGIQIDDGPIATTSWSGGTHNGSNVFELGRDASGWTAVTFDGLMKRFGLWKRVLKQTEYDWLRNGNNGRTAAEIAAQGAIQYKRMLTRF